MYLNSLLLGLLAVSASNARPSPESAASPELEQPQLFGRTLNEEGGFSFPAFKRRASKDLSKRTTTAASNNNWWITIGVGSPPQDLNVLPDTGANNFVIQSTFLPANRRGLQVLYDPSKSSTAKQVSGYTYSQAYGSGYSSNGVVYQESITFGTSTFSNVYVCLMTNQSSVSPLDRNGNLGLDANTGGQSTSPKTVPSFMQSIRSSISKGVATFNYNTYTLTGELDIGFINTTKYTGQLAYVNKNAGETLWVVNFDGMVVNGTVQKIPFKAVVDTGSGDATLPRAAIDSYFSQVPSAQYNQGFGTYLFPCDTNLPDMTFSVGGLALRIPKATWIGDPIGDSNTCGCSILASLDGNAFLGEAFIEGAFVVFDYDNLRVGFANKPQSTVIPKQTQAGSTYFCTGTGFTGTCQNLAWNTASCNTLQSTPFYHNIGSFGPDHGGCTLYSDNQCTAPISDSQNIRNPGKTDAGASGKTAGSYTCIYPADYYPLGTGTFYLCNDINYRGTCQNYNWNSYACQTITNSALKSNVSSAGPNHGYCYTYTDANCVNNIEGAAPYANPGDTRAYFGKQIQSFMCV